MLLFGSIAAAAVTAGALTAWWWLRRRRSSLANSIGIVALSLWAGTVAIKLSVDYAKQEPAGGLRGLDSIAWPIAEPLPAWSPPSTASGVAPVHAAPVDSLIGGLETRLAAEPDDSAGWSLLAQSYAFVANRQGAETAVQRAVALGVDEATLRERVQSAERSAAPVDWVDETLRAARQRRLRASGEAR